MHNLFMSDSGRVVVPLMGYPGVQLTGSNLRQNAFNADLHARTILALAERFQPDALLPFMDLTVEAGALGLPVAYPLHESPTVAEHPVKTAADLEPLRLPDIRCDARALSIAETVRRIKRGFAGPVGGYVSGPFTLAGLMMGAQDVALATRTDTDLLHDALALATGTIIRFAHMLVDAGADMIVILEPTASFISAKAFKPFSGDYIKQIIDTLDVPTVLHICGRTNHLISAMVATGTNALSLDTDVKLAEIAPSVPPQVALIGNIDPVGVMSAGRPEDVRSAVRQLASAMQPYPNFVMSTGCDLPPETPLDNIAAFMETARAIL